MSLIRFVLFSLIVAFGAWRHYDNTTDTFNLEQDGVSPSGFVLMPSPYNTDANQVVIFSPIDCPREAGQRAEALAESLGQQQIPFV